MLLTKDNLLRYVREKKYTTPTHTAEAFETTTMIASAALSEIANEKLIAITHLKLASSPYYYDPRQPQALQELADKHLKDYDREIYLKLKEEQVINDASLSIQLRLAVARIKDFVRPLEISHADRQLKLWVWYLRDLNETRQQVLDALKGKPTQAPKVEKSKVQSKSKQTSPKSTQSKKETQQPVELASHEGDDIQHTIEGFFKNHYLRIESKQKDNGDIVYELSLKIHDLKTTFDAIYFSKKPTESGILKFYGSTTRPKIVFAKNPTKKLMKMAESLDNLTLVTLS